MVVLVLNEPQNAALLLRLLQPAYRLKPYMLPKWAGTALLLAACAAFSRAEDAYRPACNQKNAGLMWPEAANRDHMVRARAAHCGELEMCTRDVWHYRWKPLTVRVDQLPGGNGLRKPSGCEAAPEPAQHSPDATK